MNTIQKSSRHAKITGDWAEATITYWLSRHGYECARFDHVGIDIIARRPADPQPLGISVKSRSRAGGTESVSLDVDLKQIELAKATCEHFGCMPYMAYLVDRGTSMLGYMLPIERLLEICPPTNWASGSRVCWKMTRADLTRYEADPVIRRLEMTVATDTF